MNHSQKLMGAIPQSFSNEAKSCYATPSSDTSPILSALDSIDIQLSNAHEKFSMLENKVHSIRACEPESIGECKPICAAPTMMEQRLQSILDTVRYLSARIGTTTDELRI